MSRRFVLALVLALIGAGLTGCASVPDSSPVQVLRQIGDGEDVQLPPGPADGSNPLDLVRDFVFAAGSSADQHRSARRFLAPDVDWDDAASLTVLGGQFDTVPAPGALDPGGGTTTIRIRGTALGRITASGSFEPGQGAFQQDVTVVRVDGQWRISRLPDGTVVPLMILRQNYRTVRTWFVDPVRRLVIADLRYLPSVPARAQATRALELLLAGPSGSMQGAAVSQLPPEAQLRSNVAMSSDGALIVDLTRIGELDRAAREVLAAQVVLTLAEVNVAKVRLLVDGEPLLAGTLDLTRDDVVAHSAEVQPAPDVPGLVVSAGRLRQLTGPEAGAPVPGPLGDGRYDVESAASTVDGRGTAAVTRQGERRKLVVGATGGEPVALSLDAATMTRPTWAPTGLEVWTVLDSRQLARVVVDPAGPPRTGAINAAELTAIGPIRDLRLSRDGMRVAAVVDGALYTAAVARGADGEVAIRNVRRLRATDLGEVVAADWRAPETIVAITRGTQLLVGQVSVDGLGIQPVVGQQPDAAADRHRRGVRPTAAGDRSGRGLELRWW